MWTKKWLECAYVLMPMVVLLGIPPAVAKDTMKTPGIVRKNCSGCHGMDGNSELPYFPRIAGLKAKYAEQKLLNFRNSPAPQVDEAFTKIAQGWRPSKDPGITPQASEYMVGVAHSISDADVKVSAQWYERQEPGPGRRGDPKLIAEGKSVFLNGLKSRGLIACQMCHGPDANGTANAPRLAGQNAAYMMGQLALFRAGDRQHSPEMTTVVQNVDGGEARAVTAYLQSR